MFDREVQTPRPQNGFEAQMFQSRPNEMSVGWCARGAEGDREAVEGLTTRRSQTPCAHRLLRPPRLCEPDTSRRTSARGGDVSPVELLQASLFAPSRRLAKKATMVPKSIMASRFSTK